MLRHRLVAHRGYQRNFPENTLIAMTAAVAAGALYIETDIQFTRDQRPVLYHDPFLARVSGLEGNIGDLNEADALATPASEPFRFGERFATETIAPLSALVDFLQNHREVTAFIEAKEEAIAAVGRETACHTLMTALAPVQDQSVLISFDSDFIAVAKAQGFPRVGLVVKDWPQIDSEATRAIDPAFIFTNIKHIPDSEDLSRFSAIVVVYEVAEPDIAINLFNRGADMVETFDIGGMIDSLASHSL